MLPTQVTLNVTLLKRTKTPPQKAQARSGNGKNSSTHRIFK